MKVVENSQTENKYYVLYIFNSSLFITMVQVGERYRHYKSTPEQDHIYEVIGIARHTETRETLVLYKPLYEESEPSTDHTETMQDFLGDVGADCCARPLSMWDEEVEWEGKMMKRFVRL